MATPTKSSSASSGPNVSAGCLTDLPAVVDDKKVAALAWYQRWQRLVDLHENKLEIQAEMKELCKSKELQDDFASPLRIRDSVGRQYSDGVEYDGTGRHWFTCFLKMVFEAEPEFFRCDDDKRWFALMHFTPAEIGKYEARIRKFGQIETWNSVKAYLEMHYD
ncbi:hypothetical protein OC845_001093 [Tilletia horrida]|nr:hypothetical protein OC845_001093 [Tilletia horrida]